MSKITIAGLLACAGSLLLLGFQAISTLMDPSATVVTKKESMVWQSLSLESLLEPQHLAWINDISFSQVQRAADYIVAMPLYLLLLAIGILMLLIGAISSKL